MTPPCTLPAAAANPVLEPGRPRPSGRCWPLRGVVPAAPGPQCQAQVAEDINHSQARVPVPVGQREAGCWASSGGREGDAERVSLPAEQELGF